MIRFCNDIYIYIYIYILKPFNLRYVCIRSVFILTTECASLTVTLVVTLRKFASLLFSIVYFSNPFTSQHWIGSLLVFGGTFLFSGVFDGVIGKFYSKPTHLKVEAVKEKSWEGNDDVKEVTGVTRRKVHS